MTKGDLPDTGAYIVIGRKFALGGLLALAAPLIAFGMTLQLSDARQNMKLDEIERRIADEHRLVAQVQADQKTMAPELAVIKSRLDAIYELLREERLKR